MHFLRVLSFLTLLLPALPMDAQEAPSGTITTEQSGEMDANIAVRIREILGELARIIHEPRSRCGEVRVARSPFCRAHGRRSPGF